MIDWELFYNRLRTPDFLPGYEIQNRLGGGAFGDVYKARKQSIGKVYAVKFLKVETEDVALRELDQVSYFASIDHPNLVSVEDVGVVMGVPYVMMGYAGEDTLARRIQRGDLEPDALLRYFVQACRGVLALHDRRLAHFDLKPSNIFIKGDVARVGDYGLAKLLSDGRQTLSFGRGTPYYMAPEMLGGRADHRADIYSLGVILFEGLSGFRPFGLDDGMVVRDEDTPPDFPDDFPAALRGLVERATRLDPDHRYWSVLDLLADMGQTARQGDSVRFDVLADGHPAPLGASEASASASGDGTVTTELETLSGQAEPETPVSDDFRRTAAELARGAVGVARGVWDGVFARSSEAFGRKPRNPGPAEAEGGASDIVSIQTMDDPDEYERSATRTVLSILAKERKRRAGGVGEDDEDEDADAGGSSARERTFSPWNALPVVSAQSVGRTVPVPPAADGGLIGSLAATCVLGFEVMVALLTGPMFYVLRGVGRTVDRSMRSVPGVLGSALKLGLFLALLALLGGTAVLVVILLFVD